MTHPESKPVLKDLPYGIQGLYLLYIALSYPSRTGGIAMTPLRPRMIEDLQRRGLSERTQEMSVRAVRHLAEHDHKSPERITEEALRDSCLSVKNGKHSSRSASTSALCGITCCYARPLKRAWTILPCGRPPQEHKLPVVLSLEDVH